MEGARVDLLLQVGPDLRVLARDVEVVDDGAEVEPRAPDQHRPPAPRRDVGEDGAGVGLEAGHGVVLPRIGHVEQVVDDLGPLGGGGLGRAHVHAPVDLHGVDRHQLHVREGARRLEGHGRLPGRGGAHQGHRRGGAVGRHPGPGVRAPRIAHAAMMPGPVDPRAGPARRPDAPSGRGPTPPVASALVVGRPGPAPGDPEVVHGPEPRPSPLRRGARHVLAGPRGLRHRRPRRPARGVPRRVPRLRAHRA